MYFLLECYSNTYSILFKMPCGFCHRTGHNRLTCPAFKAVRERDGQQRHLIELMDSQREMMIEQLEQERNVIRNTPLIIHNIMNVNTQENTHEHFEATVLQTPGRPAPQTPPHTPPPLLAQTPPPGDYPIPDAPLRMGRRGRRGGEWRIEPMDHLFNDDDEIYTPKKKQLVTCVECPCETISCAICMEDLTQVDLMVTRCGHQFHSGCMITHLRKKDECPLCRGILVA